MKSVVLSGNMELRTQERPVPSIRDNEFLVRVEYVGICNSDIFRAFSGQAYSYPLVMGHEISGEIADAGPKAGKFFKGQKVVVFPLIPCRICDFCKQKKWVHCQDYDYFGSRRDGGFQEYLAVNEWNILPVPGEVDNGYSCLCEPVAVSVHAIEKIGLSKSDGNAAVIGAGLIGLTAAKLLHEKGWETTVTDRNKFKLDLAEQIGLHVLPFEEALSMEDRFSVVLEATGAVEMFRKSLKLARHFGTIIWLGNIQGNLDLPQKEVSKILRKELTIKGVWNSNYQQGRGDDWEKALQVIGENSWIEKLVTHRIPLEHLPSMLKELYSIKSRHRSHNIVKVVVDLK
jgi:L-iditol 2-dehydrogenase